MISVIENKFALYFDQMNFFHFFTAETVYFYFEVCPYLRLKDFKI